MPKKLATRARILEGAIDCIERYGLDHVTTRRIAQVAGTNIAAINYHFRSKDELIAEVMSLTIRHMLEDVHRVLVDRDKPFETVLREVFRYLVEGSWRYPGLSRAHIAQAVALGPKDSIGARAIIRVYSGLVDRARRAYPRKPVAVMRLRLAQLMHAILFVLLTPDFFGVSEKGRSNRQQQARRYAESLADLFLSSL